MEIKNKNKNKMNQTEVEDQFLNKTARQRCKDTLFYEIVFIYINRTISVSAILTSLISILIFMRIIKREPTGNGQMFKYLIAVSIFELFLFLIIIFEIGYHCQGCGKSLGWKVWYVWFQVYFYFSFITIANYLEVFATLDCFLMINNKLVCLLTKTVFVIILLFLIVFSFISYFHNIFVFKFIKVNQFNNETSVYSVGITDYFNTDLFKGLAFSLTFIREVLPLFLLLLLNILIFITLRNVVEHKKRLETFSNSNSNNNNNNIRHAIQAEISKLKMIFSVSFCYIIFRTPLAVYLLPIHGTGYFSECYFFRTSYVFYNFSYIIKFFIYYFFNKKFRKYLNVIFRKIRTIF
jgi:hypothetical protein